jgi:hypothetical protein
VEGIFERPAGVRVDGFGEGRGRRGRIAPECREGGEDWMLVRDVGSKKEHEEDTTTMMVATVETTHISLPRPR